MKEKKSLIIIGVFIISMIIILFGGALIYNKFFFKKSYSEVEVIMKEATVKYFEKYEEKLPNNINDSITVTVDTLVNNNMMDTIVSYTKEKQTTCEGEVRVTNINGDYRYATILDCGEAYTTQTLTDYIDENVSIVTNGNGLYKMDDALVYRGDSVDNYLKLNGKVYRIVKFVNGHPVIILTDNSESVQWDDRYNINNDSDSGINDYEKSRMKEYLNKVYKSNTESSLLSEDTRMLVTSYDLPIGKRKNADTDKTGALENAKVLTNQYIGLLPVSDFLNVSLDENCNSTIAESCKNYNYLSKYKYTWWTVTANSTNTYKVYVINKTANTALPNAQAYIRPVLHLAKDTIYVSGDGSKNNPFIVK